MVGFSPNAPPAMDRGPLPPDTARTIALTSLLSISIYMSFLTILNTLLLFKKRTTLYFYSLLLTATGIAFHSLAVLLKWFVGACPWPVYTAFSSFGWWGMVTGQSLVLYSRLHLVGIRDLRVLRTVLAMIIVDFLLFQVPTTMLKFVSSGTNTVGWLAVYHVYERVQLAVFVLQEVIISTIYIRAAVTWLLSPTDPDPERSKRARSSKRYLVYLNILCIALDLAIIVEVSLGAWIYEEATQSLTYAIKLALEFAVLNMVMEVYRTGPGRSCATCQQRSAGARMGASERFSNAQQPGNMGEDGQSKKRISKVLGLKRAWWRQESQSSNIPTIETKRPCGSVSGDGTTPGLFRPSPSPLPQHHHRQLGVVTHIDAVSSSEEVLISNCPKEKVTFVGQGQYNGVNADGVVAVTSDITTVVECRDSDDLDLESGRGSV